MGIVKGERERNFGQQLPTAGGRVVGSPATPSNLPLACGDISQLPQSLSHGWVTRGPACGGVAAMDALLGFELSFWESKYSSV